MNGGTELDRSERWKNWAGAGFHLVMIVAVTVGGAWTLYQYNSLLKQEVAQIELERGSLEVRRDPSLRIWLEVEQLPTRGDGEETPTRLLVITVHAENPGIRLAAMSMKDGPLLVSLITNVDRHGKVTRSEVSRGQSRYFVPVDSTPPGSASAGRELLDAVAIVHPLTTLELPFLVEVPGAGTYQASFAARAASLDSDGRILRREEIPEDPLKGSWWKATRYFVVE